MKNIFQLAVGVGLGVFVANVLQALFGALAIMTIARYL